MGKKVNISTLPSEERAAIEARREYQRQWRAANRDRVRVHNERYWKKKAAENTIEQEHKELSRQVECEDKKKALGALVNVLGYTRGGENIDRIDVSDNDDTALISFIDGGIKTVNISSDSALAAIIDVCRALI